GTLSLNGGGGKLVLTDGQIYVTPGGKITTNNNSQIISIGGKTIVNGTGGNSTIQATNATGVLFGSSAQDGLVQNSTLPVALPVKFINFNASRQGKDVQVQWATASEENSDRFDVETSTDGRNWATNGSVAAAGNSNSVINYNYTARSIAGTVQVRIRQVDIDGKYTYTDIRTVKGDFDGSVKVTAGSGRLNIQFGTEVKGATVRIMNLNGQVLQEQKFTSAVGQVTIPTNYKGICVVSVLSETEQVATQKVIL
ncbi:MAG: T9SS type A sorting domain-containing protein, partial [Sphingobacteriales bacterium]